jgi:hypothetical protein
MNCLYITLFFNIVAGIVQTFIKSRNQLLYLRVIEVCCLPFEPRHFLYLNFSVTASWIVVVDTLEWCDATRLLSRVDLREFLLQFPEECRQRQRWPTVPLFVVNISPSLGEFTAPLRHILPIRNVTIKSNNLFVNFCVEKLYDFAFGGTLDRRCHFKHVSLKQSRFYHCQTSTAHR